MMPYYFPIPHVWYPVAVTREARDTHAPHSVGPRVGFATKVRSAARFLARVVSRLRRPQGDVEMLPVKMQGQMLAAVQRAGRAGAPVMDTDGDAVGTHAAHPNGHGH